MSALRQALLALLLAGWAALAHAQGDAGAATSDYALWDNVASRAERAVDDATDDSAVFEVLRSRIVGFREQFDKDRNANAERIATLRAQIAALEPSEEAAASGETDARAAVSVESRRIELETQLKGLLAPVQVADEAFRRADGLVRQIDQIIRERQAERLLSLGPSPLNPLHWGPAAVEVGGILARVGDERLSWGDPTRQRQARDNLPVVVLLFAIAGALIFRGRKWAGMAQHALRRVGGSGASVWRFLVSLFRIILPLLGIFALASALRATGLAGVRINQIIDSLPVWGGVLLGFRWLAERLFARDPDEALIALGADQRSQARFYMLLLSVLFVLRGVAELFLRFDPVSPDTQAVAAFPIVALTGLVLAFLGLLLRKTGTEEPAEGEALPPHGPVVGQMLRFAGTAVIFVAATAPAMAAIGYAEAGNFLLYPTLLSLLVLGLVMALQRFLADLYGFVTGQGAQAREALLSVLMGFVLVVAACPLLALAWGARVADLTELWTAFRRGFDVGGTRISPADFLAFALVFVLVYALTRLVQGVLRGSVLPKTRLDIGAQNAIVSGMGYVGIVLAALLAITAAGINLSSFAIVAGALSVGIGFGLQNIVSNFVSGIILLIERPISEGDWIEVGGQQGYVRAISVRSTRIETFERTDVIIPNADLVSGTVTNFTRGNTIGRLIVKVGVAYGTDTRKVDKVLREIAEAQPMVLANPAPVILFDGFGADALEFQVRVILRDVNWIISVKNDINHAIAERFAEEGIEVPFAQRDIWLRNPEALKGVIE